LASICNVVAAGYFGVGWLRDLWRLPEYVKEANGDPAYEKELSRKMKESSIPPWKAARWMGMLCEFFFYQQDGSVIELLQV
jgi:DnaJ family protein C protein 22